MVSEPILHLEFASVEQRVLGNHLAGQIYCDRPLVKKMHKLVG